MTDNTGMERVNNPCKSNKFYKCGSNESISTSFFLLLYSHVGGLPGLQAAEYNITVSQMYFIKSEKNLCTLAEE